MTPWHAVVFDLDDTLYPEKDYVLSGFRAVSRWVEQHLGIPAATAYSAFEALFGAGVRGDTFNRWVLSQALSSDLVPTLVAVYREHRPSVRPFPGIEELLAKLERRYALGLVTDGYRDAQQAKLNALGLAHAFRAVVFSDDWGRENWKPSARPFLEVIRALGVAADEAVYVADNPIKDFHGARRVGLSTIWCRYSNGDYCHRAVPSSEHAPDAVVDTVRGLEARLLPAGP